MVRRRRSALQAAEKLVARGKLEAAVKEYRKAVAEDPEDTSTLNRLGDLCARLNRVDEAVQIFLQAGDHFTTEGFFVKAIAIYKKIIRLDPTRIDVYETLADLYQRQGLFNEARSQYQVVADYHTQSGNQALVPAIYLKMVELEPNNPSHRLKLAELYCETEQFGEAMAQYQKIAAFMLEHDKEEEALKVYLGAYELRTDDLSFLTEVIVELDEKGHQALAARLLREAIERNPEAESVAELVELPGVEYQENRGVAAEGPVATVAEPQSEPEPKPKPKSADAPEVVVESPSPTVEDDDGAEADVDDELAIDTGVDEEPAIEDAEEAAVAAPTPEAPSKLDAPVDEDTFEIDLSEIEAVVADEAAAEAGEEAAVEASEEPEPEPELEGEPETIEIAAATGVDVDEEPEPEPPVEAKAVEAQDEKEEEIEVSEEAALAARAEEMLTEAHILASYGLEPKAREMLDEVLSLVPDKVEAGELLLQLHQDAGRTEEVTELAARFVRDGALPEPLAGLIEDWGYQVEEDAVVAVEAEPEFAVVEPVESPEESVEEAPQPATADVGLDWLGDQPEETAAGESDKLFGEETDFFDLAAELEEELKAEEARLGAEILPQLEEQSIEEIVEGFKQGVAETLSSEDYDTHFNLGIAYREMGLVDEAIGEFQLAAKADDYLVECCSLLGACFLEKGFPDLAIKWYERGLDAPNVTDDERLGLLYELGNLYLSTGEQEPAKEKFVEIYGTNSNYRDVVAKLEELRR